MLLRLITVVYFENHSNQYHIVRKMQSSVLLRCRRYIH